MIWLLTIPAIVYFTFSELIAACFPDYACHGTTRGFLGWCFLVFVGCFISALISAVPILIGGAIGAIPERRGYKDSEFPLVALRERDGVAGHFFLGTGFIGSEQYYFWYRKNDDGAISGGKTYREPGVTIYEDDSNPRMTTYTTKYVSDFARQYLWLIGIDMRGGTDWCPTFHIPKGSVKEGYSL